MTTLPTYTVSAPTLAALATIGGTVTDYRDEGRSVLLVPGVARFVAPLEVAAA